MEIDKRKYDWFVIEKDGRYLKAAPKGIYPLRWTTSPWDAYKDRRRGFARKTAENVGGKMRTFNTLDGRVKG